MKLRNLFLLATLPTLLALIGCGPNTTGTGGTKTEATKPDGGKEVKDESFKVTGPGNGSLKNGESKTYDFKIEKGKNMASDVDVTAEGPDKDKLVLEVAPAKVSATGDGKFTLKVTAKDAPVAEHTVKLTAKPEKGNPVVAEIKVKVEKP